MTVISNTYLPRDAHQPRGRRPWCATCDTDRHLLADAVTTLNQQLDTLAAAVSCARCGGSRVLATTAAFLAAISTPAEHDRAAEHDSAAVLTRRPAGLPPTIEAGHP